ncbi:MAG TPA: glycosyltransferase [Solirubrobacterales bacterium]|nr:glycosyltransferase [Solirubrobacterales bacterium]
MTDERPRISVVVPTRERPQLLRRCLAALEAQSVSVEIVVVEDADGRGPAWARNEGVRRSRGEIVCFTDDDCEPTPTWAETLATPILAGQARATSGPVTMGDEATPADRAWEAIVSYLQQQASTPGTASPGFAATANLACTRSLMEELPFDESFPAAAGEDRDWAERATGRGARPLLVPEAVAVHTTGSDWRAFLRQQYRYGRGAVRYRSTDPERGYGSPSFYFGLLRRGFAEGLASGLLVCVAQAATLAGAVAARTDGPQSHKHYPFL